LGTTLVDEFFKVRYYNVGGFGQLQYGWAPHISLTLGARADYNSRYGGTFNPRAGVVLQPTAATTVKLLFGTAFLAPSPYQSYAHYGSFYSSDGGATYASDYWHLGNPDLKPQRKRTLEVNAQHTMASSFIVGGSAFVSRFTDHIKSVDADQSYAGTYHGWPVAYIDFPVNGGDSTIYGGTVDARFVKPIGRTGRVEARVGLAVATGDTRDEDDTVYVPIGGLAPWQLRFSTDVEFGAWSFAPRLAVVSRQRLLATREELGETIRESLPGYAVTDVTVQRRLVGRSVAVFANLTNAFDRRYRTVNGRAVTNPEELVGAPQNPRRLTVGVSLRFD
jgi:outer membrane receptor protein involved in Fe transport